MILSPTSGPRDPMSSSIDNITSTLDNGGSSRFLGGPSQLFSSAQGFFGAGPMIPPSLDDNKSALGTPGSPVSVKINNLPRDITDREFKALFTFAHEFMYAELHKAGNDVLGFAYFKSYAGAAAAHTVLDMRSDIFFVGPMKCEITRDVVLPPGTNSSSDNESVNHSPSYESLRKKGSRFVFAEPTNGYEGPPEQQSGGKNAQSPRSLFPIGSIDGAVSGDDMSLYASASSNGQYNNLPHHHPAASGKSLLLESRDDEEFNNLVKDPVRFFARDSGFMGFPSTSSSTTNAVPVPTAAVAPGPPSKPGSGSASASSPSQVIVGPPGQTQQSHASSNSPTSSASSRPTLASIASQGLSTQASSASASSNSNTSTSPPGRSNTGGPQLTPAPPPAQNQWEKRRTAASVVSANGNGNGNGNGNNSTSNQGAPTRQFSQLSINTDKANGPPSMPAVSNGNGDPSKVVVPYSPTNNSQAIQIMQNGGRVLPPANPADQNPPCNTLYVGNLPPDTSEDELKELFSSRRGYKRLCFRTKANGPMCFVEFEDVPYAARALEELYGFGLSNSVKGGIRLSFSKNPLGVRGNSGNGSNNNNNNNGNSNGHNSNNNSNGNSSNSNGNTSNGTNTGAGGSLNNNGTGNRYNRYHGSVNYAEAASQGYMK